MKNKKNIFYVKSFCRPEMREYWLSSTENHGAGINIIDHAVDFLRSNKAQAFSIRLFGRRKDLSDAEAEFREQKVRCISCPPLLLENDAELKLQIHAVSGTDSKPLIFEDKFIGREFEDNNSRSLMLHLLPDDADAGNYGQAENIFNKADRVLGKFGSGFSDVIRTWLYAEDILAWYDLLNKARNRFFELHKIYDHLMPASTGIGLTNLAGAAMAAQILAVIPKDKRISIREANSPLQNEALNYKSSFSRGVKMKALDHRKLYISGTASIDKNGKTVFVDSTAGQIDLTMDVVNAILRAEKMNWSDTASSLVYFKHHKDFHLFDSYCKDHNLNIPHIKLEADVCRENLLFEIELDAVK